MLSKRLLMPFVLGVVVGVAAIVPGVASAATFTSSDGPVVISDYSGGPTPASPSPSVITVDAGTQTVSKATVTLHGLTHTCVSDLNVLLVAPNGSSVVLIAQIGPCSTATGDVTFDDSAATSFADAPNAAGTWRPAQAGVTAPGDCNWTGSLVSPAPAGPYGSTLASVAGGPATGQWKLYIEDGCSLDTGVLASWSLDLSFGSTASRGGYCSVKGNTNPFTGAAIPPGTFLDLTGGQVVNDSHYTGAVPANYLQGLGITCDVLPGYAPTGQTVGYFGPGDPGMYIYYKKAG